MNFYREDRMYVTKLKRKEKRMKHLDTNNTKTHTRINKHKNQ